MEYCQLLSFLVLIYNITGFVTGRCQPPVMENSPYTMDCSFPLSRDTRKFQWTISSGVGGPSHPIFTCDFGSNYCKPQHGPSVSVTYSSNPTTFTSSLRLMVATAQNKDSKLGCNVWNAANGKFVTIKSCPIEIYHPPESPSCQSMQLDNGDTEVVCETPKVYPDILCQLYEGHNENVPTQMTNNKVSSLNSMYSSASCSFTVSHKRRNAKYLHVKMFASIDGRPIFGSEQTLSIYTRYTSVQTEINVGKSLEKNKDDKADNTDRQSQTFNTAMFSVIGSIIFTVLAVGSYLCVRKCRNLDLSSKCKNDDHQYISVDSLAESHIYDTITTA